MLLPICHLVLYVMTLWSPSPRQCDVGVRLRPAPKVYIIIYILVFYHTFLYNIYIRYIIVISPVMCASGVCLWAVHGATELRVFTVVAFCAAWSGGGVL